ncbi:hypothetical protein SFA35_03600 [Pseudomonas sp. HR96]|uniref:hypothetical protein n=1 Tax=Pseudomonas sp. HR96 TaxID=1027966 RepID=UPI002A74EFC8|nr:hypothetical protein [Pseudomonas sp. HR96]WPP00483.1 hypothetical protein SFA35_03600 [Pseudomonas sp. HR96]
MSKDHQPAASMLSSVATFVAGMSADDKRDISDMLRQADIFASTTWRRHDHFSQWMDYHDSRLVKHGCTKLGPLFMDPLFIKSAEDLQKPFALKMFSVRESLKLRDLTIEALNQSGYRDFCIEFIKHGSARSVLTANQTVPCMANPEGGVSLMVCGLQAVGKLTHDGSREVVLRIKGGEYIFNAGQYAKWREEVHSHLLRYGQQQLKHIEL